MTDATGEPVRVALASWLPADLPLDARIQTLMEGAVVEALSPLLTARGQSGHPPPRLRVVIAISDDRPGLPPRWGQVMADGLQQALAGRFPGAKVELRSSGHAAGATALQRGCQLVLNDEVELCLVGGADSHLGPENLLQLEAQRQLHGADDNSWGFIPGEASGFCLLATHATARHYGLASLLELVSVAVARERHTFRSGQVCTGTGLSQAVAQVLAAGRAAQVDVVVTDQNGEPQRADEFGFTLARHAERFRAPPNFQVPATSWGDVGAASAPLFASLIIASGQRGYAAGEHALLLTSSETEERGALLVRLDSLPQPH